MRTLRKYVDIDIRETVNVGIELDFNELVQIIQQCTDKEKDEILLELKGGGVIPEIHGRTRVTLLDQMKIDFFRENFNKISIDQLQTLV